MTEIADWKQKISDFVVLGHDMFQDENPFIPAIDDRRFFLASFNVASTNFFLAVPR